MSHAGKKIYISSGPVGPEPPADSAAYEALTFIEVKGAGGEFPEGGPSQATGTFEGADKIHKTKKNIDYGGGAWSVKRISGDAGQAKVREAGETNYLYAFKIVYQDQTGDASGQYSNTTDYCTATVSGPVRSNGDGHVLDNYELAFDDYQTQQPAQIA